MKMDATSRTLLILLPAAPPAPPHAWRHRALALAALCLLLLIGLGVLGSICMYYPCFD